MCIVHPPLSPPADDAPRGASGTDTGAGSCAAPVGAAEGAACGSGGVALGAAPAGESDRHNTSPGRTEASTCDSWAALTWRQPAPLPPALLPVAVSVPREITEGAETDGEEPAPEVADGADDAVSEPGLGSVGGAARVVSPPEEPDELDGVEAGAERRGELAERSGGGRPELAGEPLSAAGPDNAVDEP